MKTRPYHHGDLRAALLARAERMLRDKGPGALSLRELARGIGVSHAAPSRHFKDKQALLDALALEGFGRLAAVMTAAREEAGGSFADRMVAVGRAYVGFATDNAVLLDLMYAVKHDPAASRELTDASYWLAGFAMRMIEDGQRTGEVREGPAERIGLPVMSALHGFAALVVSGALHTEEIDQGLADTVGFILRGCAP
ncbi:TetR/AcrR family transcriptional regulator [Streptomyces caeni]|uniref:TetR/AcrR family transcriptional regulator n=1 Tax=Streptomyces caeni TaxID=2307231 RepID=A0ABW4IJQ1_9ACTN